MTQKIHQLVHTLSYGDAISSEVITIQRILKEKGFDSEIYAINTHSKYQGLTKDYKTIDDIPNQKIILHYSIGSDLNNVYLNLKNAKKFLIYHNITPKKFFDGINFRVACSIEEGLKELPFLCKNSDMIISDSNFNASDLSLMGINSKVLPLPFDDKKWDIEENQGIKNILRKGDPINILHVGRLAKNKCVEDVIKSFFYLHSKIEKNSKLYLVGIDTDTEIYSFMLKELIHDLNLEDSVYFCGAVADTELKAFYKNSSAYICLSEHEGFCVPILEAMNFSLPVISFDGTALKDTVGDGGILINEKDHVKIAELLYKVSTDKKIKNEMIVAGKKRVEEFSIKNFSKKFLEIFCS